MRILILNQDVEDKDTLNQGLTLSKNYASTIGLNLEFFYKETIKQFTSIPVVNNVVLNGYMVNPTEIFQEAKATNIPFDVDCLIFNADNISPRPTNPADGGMNIQIPTFWYGNYPEVFAEFFIHELSHYFAQLNGVVDKTHLKYDAQWNHQFDQKTNIDYYLFLIKPFLNTEPYFYFKLNEPTGGGHTVKELKPELMKKLDSARGFTGIPFKITSGFRTQSENASIGGVKDSAHTLGLGVDILADNDSKRLLIVSGAIKAGFTRIGMYNNHVHLDCGLQPNFPQNVMWISQKD